MKKIIISSILAGIVVTIWGVIAWVVFNFHKDTFKNCPDDKNMANYMYSTMENEGVYLIPARPERNEEFEEYQERLKAGPIAVIFFTRSGTNMTRDLVIGTLLNILTAVIASWFLARSTAFVQSYFKRVAYVAVLPVFASLAIHFQNMNWMYFPLKYTAAMSADLIIGWILGGMVIAAFIKEK